MARVAGLAGLNEIGRELSCSMLYSAKRMTPARAVFGPGDGWGGGVDPHKA